MKKLEYRRLIRYLVYTEYYTNMGITRQEMLDIANDINGVIGAHPYGINDELEVILSYRMDIEEFIDMFKYRLDKLLDNKNK